MKQILLAGGIGKRVHHIFKQPKQFARFFLKNNFYYSTFMLAVERALILNFDEIIVIVNKNYLYILIDQLAIITNNNFDRFFILVENTIGNTMLAVYSGIKFMSNFFSDSIKEKILISPVDHIILSTNKYKQDIENAIEESQTINLFGINPLKLNDSSSYGNIFCNLDGKISNFIEKPNSKDLAYFLKKNLIHYWNSGIFLVGIDFVINAIDELFYHHKIKLDFQSYITFENKNGSIIDFPLEKIFFLNRIDNVDLLQIPFDLLLSKCIKNISVSRANFDWLDIGSEDALKGII